MGKWIPLLPPLAALLVAAALLRHSWISSPIASDFALHPLVIVALALIYPLIGRKAKAR